MLMAASTAPRFGMSAVSACVRSMSCRAAWGGPSPRRPQREGPGERHRGSRGRGQKPAYVSWQLTPFLFDQGPDINERRRRDLEVVGQRLLRQNRAKQIESADRACPTIVDIEPNDRRGPRDCVSSHLPAGMPDHLAG